jgi:hypothetical protein
MKNAFISKSKQASLLKPFLFKAWIKPIIKGNKGEV